MEEIIEDLNKRGLKVVSMIAENKDGKLVLISYDSRGLVSFLSREVASMHINEDLGGRMSRAIASVCAGA